MMERVLALFQTMLKMSDIAQRAGVSSSTVSFVLNDRHEQARISDATRQKVLSVAQEMGYRANHGARAMRTGNTRMIGLVGGDLAREQVGAMVSGALEELELHGYTLKLLTSRLDDSLEAVQQVFKRGSELRLQGAIAMHLSAQAITAFEAEAKRYKYPLLLLDTRAPGGVLPEVISDDETGVSAAIAHLVGLGHRRIGLISGDVHDVIVPSRRQAFVETLRSHGLSAPENYLQPGDFSLREPSLRAAHALLGLPAHERPTALLCMGDLIALATIQVAGQLNLRVPDDLSVVGFADFALAEFANPPLTTVRQDFGAMGREAARQLLGRCAQNPADALAQPAACQRVPTQLVVRDSCGPVPKGASEQPIPAVSN